ncbi:toll/interleukin-1 receptor domain-containing protein [Halobacterium hubeiense]|uniref:toll/interleukin-1 receptor domain-containing protein n=1 Tax=Halobacterium hubeiense TaxID=1407499 RepID=UPI000B7E1197|nr:toll/interleukin-1 receptor domain-containing protein [Halobacterium hubeiense]
MATRSEILETVLEVVHEAWEDNPFSPLDGDSVGDEVRDRLDEDIDHNTLHRVLQDMDSQLFIEHTAALGSLGTVSPRVKGIEKYSESNRSSLDKQNYLKILEYLIDVDNENPGEYVDSEDVREEVDLSDEEIERNIWYLNQKGQIELMQALGSTWVAARVKPAGRRIYNEANSSARSSTVTTTAEEESLTDSEYDVFISHASEDKDQVARPLAEELSQRGVDVWFDEFELEIGDNLRESIDEGLSKTRYGVVILSENFFGKDWAERELEGLTALDMGDDKVLLPLWYEIDKEAVQSHSPALANKVAEKVNEDNIPGVAEEIFGIIKGKED